MEGVLYSISGREALLLGAGDKYWPASKGVREKQKYQDGYIIPFRLYSHKRHYLYFNICLFYFFDCKREVSG